MKANAVEIAWVAGIFEGEGTIVASSSRKSLRLQLQMTDEDIVHRFAAIVGVGQINSMKRGENKTIYYWTCAQQEAVNAFVKAVWPWLGSRRRRRYLELTQVYAAYRAEALGARQCVGCSRIFSPADNNQARSRKWCSHACRDRNRSKVAT